MLLPQAHISEKTFSYQVYNHQQSRKAVPEVTAAPPFLAHRPKQSTYTTKDA
jgi:hypothetical protein